MIELSREAADLLGHEMIGAGHLLLGLPKENEGIAARAFTNLRLTPEAVRDMILEVLAAETALLPSDAEFGGTLMALGLIAEDDLKKALEIQERDGGALADILVEQDSVPKEALPAAIGWHWALRAACGRTPSPDDPQA